jgi:site-specific recombinase XerD
MATQNVPAPSPESISSIMLAYLDMVRTTRSKRTYLSYKNGLNRFTELLEERNLEPDKTPVTALPEIAVGWFAEWLSDAYSSATTHLYLTAVKNLYEYILAEDLAQPNLVRVHQLIRQRSRRSGQRLPQFPTEDIETLLEKCDEIKHSPSEDRNVHLRNLRDRAFLLTLADTGLRVHEAVALRRGDVDWQEFQAIIIGKGDKQAVVRFSKRSINALKDYLTARAARDGNTGRPLPSLPLFARHDNGAGKITKPIHTNTGRDIVRQRVVEFLGKKAAGTITPHSFRHYFVTRVLQSSGNLKLAQRLARHTSIAVTQRYAHLSDNELDQGYFQAIEENAKVKD